MKRTKGGEKRRLGLKALSAPAGLNAGKGPSRISAEKTGGELSPESRTQFTVARQVSGVKTSPERRTHINTHARTQDT